MRILKYRYLPHVLAMAALMVLAACADPCVGRLGCQAISKHGNADAIEFTMPDGTVVERWGEMAVTGAP